MSLTGKAINYLQQQYPNASFLKDIILQDDGQGPYIKYWGVGSPKPTEAELNAAVISMQPQSVYPTVDEQLILIYNDMKNGTKTFVNAIDAANKIG